MIVVVPIVLFVTLLFMITGGSISVLFVERISTVSVFFAIIFHVFTMLLLFYIITKHKKKLPLFGLSLGLWIAVTIIGYGLGVILPFIP